MPELYTPTTEQQYIADLRGSSYRYIAAAKSDEGNVDCFPVVVGVSDHESLMTSIVEDKLGLRHHYFVLAGEPKHSECICRKKRVLI